MWQGRGRIQARPWVTSLPVRRDPQGHPIAPTEFPRARSNPGAPRPAKAWESWVIHASGGGRPGPVTSATGRRIPSRADPRKSVFDSWPKANSPQTPTAPRSDGLSEFDCQCALQPRHGRARRRRSGQTQDLCRDWSALRAFSPRLKIAQLRQTMDVTEDMGPNHPREGSTLKEPPRG